MPVALELAQGLLYRAATGSIAPRFDSLQDLTSSHIGANCLLDKVDEDTVLDGCKFGLQDDICSLFGTCLGHGADRSCSVSRAFLLAQLAYVFLQPVATA
jgi:hypothetical protein